MERSHLEVSRVDTVEEATMILLCSTALAEEAETVCLRCLQDVSGFFLDVIP